MDWLTNTPYLTKERGFLFLIKTTDIVSDGAWGRRPHTFSELTLLVNKFEKSPLNPCQARRRTLSVILPLYKATDKVGGSLLPIRKLTVFYADRHQQSFRHE